MEWIYENILALYGAVVGTLALILSFGRFWLMRQKALRKLKVASTIEKSAQKHLNKLAEPDDFYGAGRSNLIGPIYKVTVINTGHSPVHIDDAGLIIRDAKKTDRVKVYVRNGNYMLLSHLDDVGGENIEGGAKKSFYVWLKDAAIPNVIGSYVIDQTGKEFKGKHDSNGIVLSLPEDLKSDD